MRPLFVIFIIIVLGPAAMADRPNILFIAVDDLRTALGCYGDPWAKTPHIDQLASQSRIFERAYCMQAVCGPSRTALLTGRLPDNIAVWHNRNLFRNTQPNLVTLPQHFKNHGYHTVALGKVFSGDERELDPLSWSEPEIIKQTGWKNSLLPNTLGSGKGAAYELADVPDDAYPDGKLASLAINKLAALKTEGQPFFLAVGFFKPHLPFNAPKKYWDLYDPTSLALNDDGQQVQGVSVHSHHSHRELGGYRDLPKDEHVDSETALKLRHGYYACVSYVDAQIGRVLESLKQLDLSKNTVVVLWGDHGYSLGEKDRWCKGTNFERDTRVPLLIHLPAMKQPGVKTSSLVELVDLYPTLTALAGLPQSTDLDGENIAPILEDPNQPGRDAVMSQFARPFQPTTPEFMGYSLRTPTHRYTRWVSWPDRQMIAEELYDYTNPDCASRQGGYWIEEKNLAMEHNEENTRQQLSSQLDAMLQQRIKTFPANTVSPPTAPAKKKRKKNSND